ncbi:MAG: sugar phosphate isomerase/epimerase [Clostridia bacterium]|nr:sugar phosphate isomerase/epimerase [Clostridia bacterium]
MMKFGYCTGFSLPEGKNEPQRDTRGMWEYIHGLGYDHIECSVASLLNIPNDKYDEHCALCHEIGLVVGSVNCFIPGNMRLCGPEKNSDAEITAHVINVFDHMKKIGAHTIVFGSGPARAIPEGISREEGLEDIRHFLRMIAPLAAEYGITVAIEPLNRKDTNVLTSLSETYAMVRELDLPSIRMLADSYHMSVEGEEPEIPAEYVPYIKHVHIAESGTRHYPGSSGGEYVKRMLCSLRDNGYEDTVSVECFAKDIHQDLKLVIEFLKEIGVK